MTIGTPNVAFQRPAGGADEVISPTTGRRLPKKSHIYDAIIDLLLHEPTLTQTDIAARLGRSKAWVGYTVRCDAFTAQYEERRREHNLAKSLAITEGLQRVAQKSLTILETRLEKNPESVTPQMALDVTDKMLERLGYGVKLPGMVQTTGAQGVSLSAEDFALAQSIVRQVEVTHATRASDGSASQTTVKVAATEKTMPTLVASPHRTPHVSAQRDDETDEEHLDRLLGFTLGGLTP